MDQTYEERHPLRLLSGLVRTVWIQRTGSEPYPQRDLHVYHHDADGRPIAELLTKSVTDDGDLPKPAAKPKA